MLLPFPKHTLDSHLLSTQWVRRVYDFYSVRMCVTWCIHHPASRTGLETFALIRLLSTQAVVISTTTTEPFQSCGLANAIVMLEVPKEFLLSLRTSRVPTSSRCPSGKPWHFESPCLLEPRPTSAYPGHYNRALASWAIPPIGAYGLVAFSLLREPSMGYSCSECPLVCDLRMVLYARSHSSGHHVPGYDMA
jgi:hypothetical protein